MDNKLKEYLDKLGLKYKLHKHPPVFTVEESKKIKINIPGKHTKCLFLKGGNGQFYLIAMPGIKRLNIKLLKRRIGLKDMHFGSPEELKAELNATPGSVSIFAMIYAKNTKLIIDKELWNASIVTFHPNINTETLELDRRNLEIFYNSIESEKEIIDLDNL